MQPPWTTQGAYPSAPSPHEAAELLAQRSEALLQRLLDVERALAVREWWMLGRALPEARLLSEIASLLAVARGELLDLLGQFFSRMTPREDPLEGQSATEPPDAARTPAWASATRDQALGLLRMTAASLPAMRQYAMALRSNAEQLPLPTGVTDGLGIVADRLGEAFEALQQPPR